MKERGGFDIGGKYVQMRAKKNKTDLLVNVPEKKEFGTVLSDIENISKIQLPQTTASIFTQKVRKHLQNCATPLCWKKSSDKGST